MVKQTLIAIAVITLLVTVAAVATHMTGFARYGGSPDVGHPSYSYQYYGPTVAYPSSEYGAFSGRFRYPYYYLHPRTYYPTQYYQFPPSTAASPTVGSPAAQYPYGVPTSRVEAPRGGVSQLCGIISGNQYGCVAGLVCDYTKTGTSGVGVCSRSQDITTYPYQVGRSVTRPLYYYG